VVDRDRRDGRRELRRWRRRGWAGVIYTRKSAKELDVWRRREETMRLLRWAAEFAVDDEEAKVAVGMATLRALLDSRDLLQEADLEMVIGITGAILTPAVTAYDEQSRGNEIEVEYPDDGYSAV
jgi:hypothetical protein